MLKEVKAGALAVGAVLLASGGTAIAADSSEVNATSSEVHATSSEVLSTSSEINTEGLNRDGQPTYRVGERTPGVTTVSQQTVSRTTAQTTARTVSRSMSSSVARSLPAFRFAGGSLGGGALGGGAPTGANPGQTGTSGGDLSLSYGAWASGGYRHSWIEPDATEVLRRETDMWSGLVGGDVTIADRFVVGLAGGVGTADTDGANLNLTPFKQDSDFWTLAPYAAVIVTDWLYVSGMVGYIHSDYETTTYTRAGDFSNRTIGEESQTWFTNVEVAYAQRFGNFVPGARASFLYLEVDADNYTNTFGQRLVGNNDTHWTATAEVSGAYIADINGVTVVPQVAVAYEREDAILGAGENGVRLTGGVTVSPIDNLTIGLSGDYLAALETRGEYGGLLTVGYSF